jgi:hypothetical protein
MVNPFVFAVDEAALLSIAGLTAFFGVPPLRFGSSITNASAPAVEVFVSTGKTSVGSEGNSSAS